MTDKIHIRDLTLWCIIGTNAGERLLKQKVIINITLECDFEAACKSDKLEDTVNYKSLKLQIAELVEASEFFLIERMADAIAEICLEPARVSAVNVTVDKPGALTKARSVAVEIRREKSQD